MKTTSQRGFTMIELIVVIVILGILASVALPRLTSISRDARVAKLNAARGAVSAAAALVHGSALARQGQGNVICPATNTNTAVTALGGGTVCTENGIVGVTNLYPSATVTTAAGPLSGIVFASGLVSPGGQLAQEQYAATLAGGAVTFSVTGGSNSAACSFTYTPPVRLGAAPVISAPTLGGC